MDKSELQLKLVQLNTTQQSIQQTSSWCLIHRKEARAVVAVWEQVYNKSDVKKKLALLYLLNDIVQNSRRRGTEFIEEFYKVLPQTLKLLLRQGDADTKRAVMRLTRVWQERKVFGSGAEKLHALVEKGEPVQPAKQPSSALPDEDRRKLEVVGPLANLMLAVHQSAQLSGECQESVQSKYRQDILDTGTEHELQDAEQALSAYSSALQTEISARQRILQLLKGWVVTQESSLKRTEEYAALCNRRMRDVRSSLNAKQQQGGAISPQYANHSSGSPPMPALHMHAQQSPHQQQQPSAASPQQHHHAAHAHADHASYAIDDMAMAQPMSLDIDHELLEYTPEDPPRSNGIATSQSPPHPSDEDGGSKQAAAINDLHASSFDTHNVAQHHSHEDDSAQVAEALAESDLAADLLMDALSTLTPEQQQAFGATLSTIVRSNSNAGEGDGDDNAGDDYDPEDPQL